MALAAKLPALCPRSNDIVEFSNRIKQLCISCSNTVQVPIHRWTFAYE